MWPSAQNAVLKCMKSVFKSPLARQSGVSVCGRADSAGEQGLGWGAGRGFPWAPRRADDAAPRPSPTGLQGGAGQCSNRNASGLWLLAPNSGDGTGNFWNRLSAQEALQS